MFRLLDRYLVRQILLPFSLVLVGLTFALEIPPILQTGEKFIAKGVHWKIVVEVLMTLLPQALGVTIPMAFLLAVLIGLGRLSADREVVALQACGVSVFRILRPLGVAALAATAATAYVMIVALPNANQKYREITFNIIATSAEGDVKPRVFLQQVPNRVVYGREIPGGGGWRGVLIADTPRGDQTEVHVQSVLHDPAEVLAAGGVSDPRAHRGGARRDDPQGRHAQRVRVRYRRPVRLLRPAVRGARPRARRPDVAVVRAVAAKRRAGA